MIKTTTFVSVLLTAGLAGCAGLDERDNAALGGAVGGAAGAVLGHEAAGADGAVIGAGAGAATGAAIGARQAARSRPVYGEPVIIEPRGYERYDDERRHRHDHDDDDDDDDD